MSHAAQAYARISQTTAAPREIEAQALLKAARQLQEVQANWKGPDKNLYNALMFNRRLWSIFMTAAEDNGNPNTLEVRQNIANIEKAMGCTTSLAACNAATSGSLASLAPQPFFKTALAGTGFCTGSLSSYHMSRF